MSTSSGDWPENHTCSIYTTDGRCQCGRQMVGPMSPPDPPSAPGHAQTIKTLREMIADNHEMLAELDDLQAGQARTIERLEQENATLRAQLAAVTLSR
jgi:hypothetical protein